MIEMMESEGSNPRVAFEIGTLEFNEKVEFLRTHFKDHTYIEPSLWRSISSHQFNPIYNDYITSIVFRKKPFYANKDPLMIAVGRKFFMQNKWIYDKVYNILLDHPDIDYPQNSYPIALGELINVYGQPGDTDFSYIKDLYFMNADHEAVEAWAGKSLPKGSYSTFYSFTYNSNTKETLRFKTYTYDEQGAFSDWDVVWNVALKRYEKITGTTPKWLLESNPLN